MRTTKKVTPPEYEATASIICDVCGQSKPRIDWQSWKTTDAFAIDNVTVEHEEGASYPEGGSKVRETFDVCPNCWANKVRPLLMGIVKTGPRRAEIDW